MNEKMGLEIGTGKKSAGKNKGNKESIRIRNRKEKIKLIEKIMIGVTKKQDK